jgi:hypothetical protein
VGEQLTGDVDAEVRHVGEITRPPSVPSELDWEATGRQEGHHNAAPAVQAAQGRGRALPG